MQWYVAVFLIQACKEVLPLSNFSFQKDLAAKGETVIKPVHHLEFLNLGLLSR